MCAIVLAGCGKKGPPLAPLVRLPAAVDKVTVSRQGNDAYVSFTIPAVNVDRSMPVDLAYVDLYAYTGTTAPPRAGFVDQATRIARIPVAPAPKPEEPAPASPRTDAALPGAVVTVRDTLMGALAADARRFYLAIPFSTRERPGAQHMPVEVRLAALPPVPQDLHVAYSATTVTVTWTPPPAPAPASDATPAASPSGAASPGASPSNPSATSPAAASPAAPPPSSPSAAASPAPPPAAPPAATPPPSPSTPPDATSAPQPASLAGNAQTVPAQPGAAGNEASTPAASNAPPRVNVYRVMTPSSTSSAASAPEPLWQASKPAPINGSPLQTPPFTENVRFGAEVCYELRAVVGDGATAVEGEATAPVCVTPIDTFPPAAPAQLAAVATTGTINLLWEANAEPDLAGYLVLRGMPGDMALQPLTPEPITDTRFSDTTVVPGMRYVYAIVAVDRQAPVANVSPESTRVEETAR